MTFLSIRTIRWDECYQHSSLTTLTESAMNTKIITRAEARSQGLKTFFTGEECLHGHVSERYVGNGGCRECHRRSQKNWYQKNKEEYRSVYLCYQRRNREYYSEKGREWQSRNPKLRRLYSANYRARRTQATPPWADLDAIKSFYLNCPEGHEVDHIIPLDHPEISGLHVLSNLQYLTISENRSKGNRYQPS